MSLPDISLLYNYKGAAYPVHLGGSGSGLPAGVNPTSGIPPSLVDLACQSIVSDAESTLAAIRVVPTELCYSLMKAAVHHVRDRSIEVLISNWPWDVLSLHKFAPRLFDDIKVLHSDSYLNERIRNGVKYTTCLAHTFVECLKKRAPTKLKNLDLSGYPAAEVIVNYMSSHVLLVYNEARQKEIITAYKAVTKDFPEEKRAQFDMDASTLPDESYVVKMDAFLQTTDTHMELCKALRTSSKPQCLFKLCLNKLDIMCLGLARICVLLEEINPQYLTALCLQFNGLCNDALALLVPNIKKFPNLTALDLSCNSINLQLDQGPADQVASLLASLPELVRLDLSNNRTKNRLAHILSRMPRELEYLKLCGCGISAMDLAYLKSSHHARSLRELDISGNDLSRTFPSVQDLLTAVQSTLSVLEMEECDLDVVCILDFFQSFQSKYQQLRYLNISRNKLWTMQVLDEGLLRIVQTPALQAVRVSYPAECYSVSNPEYVEEDIMDYTQRINEKIETLCRKLGRSNMKLIFIP